MVISDVPTYDYNLRQYYRKRRASYGNADDCGEWRNRRMRLIDADALTGRMKGFLCDPKRCDNYGGVRCRACQFDDAYNWIDAEPTVDSVPIKPLAEWLARYSFPPDEIAAEVWEEFLRGMDWEKVDG